MSGGRSDTSFEDAVTTGLARAEETLRGVKSAWIKEQSVDVAIRLDFPPGPIIGQVPSRPQ